MGGVLGVRRLYFECPGEAKKCREVEHIVVKGGTFVLADLARKCKYGRRLGLLMGCGTGRMTPIKYA